MKIPNVRVVESSDHKGNPVWYLSVIGIPVLYSTPRHARLLAEDWEDIFRHRLGDILGKLLLEDGNFGSEWFLESPTGRDVLIEGADS